MPTNIYRKNTGAPPRQQPDAGVPKPSRYGTKHAPRVVNLAVGRVTLRAKLADTPTADRVWLSLPMYSVAETWGETIHFETPAPTGRDRTARLNARMGDICFWTSDNRIIVVFGPSPISRPGEIRLPQLCNVFAKTLDDPTALKIVTPGEKIAITRAT